MNNQKIERMLKISEYSTICLNIQETKEVFEYAGQQFNNNEYNIGDCSISILQSKHTINIKRRIDGYFNIWSGFDEFLWDMTQVF